MPLLRILVGAALTLLSAQSFALALSDIQLNSHLNQPLDARVRLESVTQADLDSLSVTVSDEPTPGQSFVTLRHEIEQDSQGSYIHITSQDVVREPILNLRVEMKWIGGRLDRNYSLIIDPQ